MRSRRNDCADSATGCGFRGRRILRTLLDAAGVRLIPVDRNRPEHGDWYGDCPVCGRSTLWVDPGQKTYQLLCGCHRGEGNVWTLLALLLRRQRP